MEDRQKTKALFRDELDQAYRRIAKLEQSVAALKAKLNTGEAKLAKYQVLFETFPLGISIADEDGRIVEANRKAEQLLGLSRHQHTRRRIDASDWRIIRPDGRPMPADEYASVRAMKTGDLVENVEMGIAKPDGTVTWINVSAAPILDPDAGVAITYSDITARRQAEEALQQSLKRFELLSLTAGELLRASDPRTAIKSLCRQVMEHIDCQAFVNFLVDERAERLKLNAYAGIPREELRRIESLEYGMQVSGYVARDKVCMVFERIQSTQDERTALLRAYGVKAYASYPLLAEGGRVIGTLAFGTNSRETFSSEDLALMKAVADQVTVAMVRLLSEQALRDNESRYRSLMELSPNAIYINRNNRIELMNPAAIELFGAASAERMLGKSPLDVFHPDSHDAIKARLSDLRKGRTTSCSEEKIIRLDGTVRDVEVSAAPFKDRDGKAFQVILRDVTERKKKEEELKQVNRVLGALRDSTQAMMSATDEEKFLQEICSIVVQDCGYSLVWIGYAVEDENKTVRPVAFAGFDEGYLQMMNITWADNERGRGPTGMSIRTGLPQRCRDMHTDPCFQPWREEAGKRGYASSLALPLMGLGKPYGAITFYAREIDTFSEDEVRLLGSLADDLAHGITALRWRVAHQQAELALEKSRERYHTLFNAMTEGFALHEIILDEAGEPCDYRFVDLNKAFERLTGLERDTLVGRTVSEVFPHDKKLWIETYGRTSLTGESIRVRNGAKGLRHYEVYAYRPAPGQLAVILRDVTERKREEEELRRHRDHLEELVRERTAELVLRNKQLEEEIIDRKRAQEAKQKIEAQLVQSQKMEALGRFAGGIAHDLNNILYPVIMDVEMLLEETPPESATHQTISQILNAAYRQRDLVKQILSFSRRSEQQIKPIRIAPLIEETLKFLRSSLPSTIEIRHTVRAEADTIMGDATQIHQIIMNLCRNAADALPSQTGVIELHLENVRLEPGSVYPEIGPGEYILLRVKDTGCGMDPEVMEKIFEPFFTTKEVGKGIGMGLSVVHGILKNHGGCIQVESEPGRGSQFSVYLPLALKGTHAKICEEVQAPSPRAKARVLVIDDEEIILSSLQNALQRSGYSVVTVNDSLKAIDVFRRTPEDFDLVITDLTMPRMTGVELTAKLMQIRSGIPIILCTGYSDIINEHQAKAMGVRELLQKPASIGELKNAVRRALEQ
ncbi:MAG: PAS domain S-box protein [Syntrophaceae bacterium]